MPSCKVRVGPYQSEWKFHLPYNLGRSPTEAMQLQFNQEKSRLHFNSWWVIIASRLRWWEKCHYKLKVRPVGDCKAAFFLIESQLRRLSGRTALLVQPPPTPIPFREKIHPSSLGDSESLVNGLKVNSVVIVICNSQHFKAPCSQASPVSVLLLGWDTKFHIHTKQEVQK
jgi:hypothetical protein